MLSGTTKDFTVETNEKTTEKVNKFLSSKVGLKIFMMIAIGIRRNSLSDYRERLSKESELYSRDFTR